jgi:Leucine-rich repeat (LRR) protein
MICTSLSLSHITHRLQLRGMGLTGLPSELFRMKNVKRLYLTNNKICSLPSDIAHSATLEDLWVRLSKRWDRDLTTGTLFQVDRNQLTSLSPELGLLTNLKWLNVGSQSRWILI